MLNRYFVLVYHNAFINGLWKPFTLFYIATGVGNFALTYILFWTLAYTLVYIY